MHPQPRLDHSPYPHRETAFVEQMIGGFVGPSAEGAKATILPTPFRQSVGRPNPVLHRQPGEELDLGWSPDLPDGLVHGSRCGPKELGPICRSSRVFPIGLKLPLYSIINIVLERNLPKSDPKIHELNNMVGCEVCGRVDPAHPSKVPKGIPHRPLLALGGGVN
jgi:hypothetical protein